MPRLIRNRALADDRYTLVRDAATLADLPDGVPIIVPLALWLERRGALIARGDIGVWLGPADQPGTLADDVERLQVIAIDFPQFTDGRGYSHARLLRERYGFKGEIRATGAVLRDQLLFMQRCGFDAFEIVNPDAVGAWRAALAEIRVFFQPTGDGRATAPLLRRAAGR